MSSAGAGGEGGGVSPQHAEAIIESSDDAILSKDPEGIITSWNSGAEALYGYSREEAVGQPISILIPSDRRGEERRILDQVIGGDKVEHYETERVRKDGTRVVISLSVSPIHGPGDTITGAAVIARDITEKRRAVERAERLQRVTAALSRVTSSAEVAEALMDDVVPALSADAATFALLDPREERLTLVASRGYEEAELEPWAAFSSSVELPLAVAVRNGEPVWHGTADELRERYPDLAEVEMRFESLAVVPLVVEDRVLGAVAFSFQPPRSFSAEERAFMMATVQQAATALERASLHEAERQARDQLAFIARASEIFGESLDLDTTLQRLADVAVPRVCDWCGVDLATETGVRNVAVAHVDPKKVELAMELRERYPPDPDSPTGAVNVIRTGEPELYTEIPDEMLEAAAEDEEHLATIRELGMTSAMVLPLKAHGETLGAITFVAAESGQHYGEDDVAFANELASHAALAIDNARRYRQEHEAALTLQRALLPRRLPEVPGIELAARYLPAGQGVEAGGDWYDVIELDGELTVVIGDVSGRGVPAASIMGRLRTAIRAYALDGHAPAAIAERTGQLMSSFEEREMATMFLLSLELATGKAEFARAGHPPALLLRPDGAVEELCGHGAPPLGIIRDLAIGSDTVTIEPGSALLLYTDGLVERRDAPIDQGIDWLKQCFAQAPEDLERALDEVVHSVETAPIGDDVAVLAMRFGSR